MKCDHNTVASVADEWATGQNDQLPSDSGKEPQPVVKKTTDIDEKSRPANKEESEAQREAVRDEIKKHPRKFDRQIADDNGVGINEYGAPSCGA